MLEEGMYVVKAGEGVCRIDSRIGMNMPGSDGPVPYFLLIPVSDPKVRVYLPVQGEHGDVRTVMSRQEAETLLGKIPEIGILEVSVEKLREQVYREAVRSCEPERLVAVLKTLARRRRERAAAGKRSTALDERYLSLAEKALYSELCFVLRLEEGEIRTLITSCEAQE